MRVALKKVLKVIFTILIIAATGGFITFKYMGKLLEREKELKMQAQTALNLSEGKIIEYRDKNNQLIARQKVLVASKQTIKKLPDYNEIKALVKNVKRLQSLLNTKYTANGSFSVPIYDTTHIQVIKNDTSYSRSKQFSFSDNFLNINCSISDSARCNYSYTDSTTTVIHVQPYGKWWQFWYWGKKQYWSDTKFSNPKTRVLYNRTIMARD